MSFDFAVDDGGSTETTNNDASPDFESNEVGDIYLSGGDWKAVLGAMLPEIPVPEGAVYTEVVGEGDDEKAVLSELKIYSDDTLEDLGRLLTKYSDAHPQQKLHMVASLLKSTAGKHQRDNEHSIGLQDGKAPEEDFEESFSYAFHSRDLPTINWESLDGGERESLEEMGIDPSALGFDTTYGGPKILVIDGQRLPIAVEEGGEIQDTLDLLQQLPNEPSAWTEDGFQESSDPSVFGDKGGETATEDTDTEGMSLATNPEAVGDFTVDEIKTAVTDISSRRTLRRLLDLERQGENRSVTERIEQRIRAVEGDEDDTEEAEGVPDEEVAESVENAESDLEDIRRAYGFSDLEMDGVQHRVESGKAGNLEEAAEQVAN